MITLLKWFIRLLIAAALVGLGTLVMNRRKIIHRVEDATERVDDTLRAAEKGIRRAEREKRDLQEKGEEAKEKVFNP